MSSRFDDPIPKAPRLPKAKRAERLDAAMRENLSRRKDQSRARRVTAAPDPTTPSVTGNGSGTLDASSTARPTPNAGDDPSVA